MIDHYTIEGLEEDEAARLYLQTVLEDRAGQLEPSDDPQQQARQEEYARQFIAGELTRAAYAKGYYDATVVIEEQKMPQEQGKDTPPKEVIEIKPGTPYTIAAITAEPGDYQAELKKLKIRVGDRLESETILKAQQDFQKLIGKGHCYFDLKIRNAVTLNKEKSTAEVTFVVEKSPEAIFGTVTFEGQKTLHNKYLNRLIPWKEGDCFRREKIETLRQSLLGSGLFSKVETRLPPGPDENKTVDITISLKERAQRTFKAGATYYTDQGLGLVLGWEHRNFWGGAEKLTADLNISLPEQSLELEMNKPFFLRKDQSLSLKAAIERQDTDAYQELGIGTGFRVNRTFGRHLTASLGTDLKISNIEEKSGEKKTFGLISGPSSVTYDSRDNTLDPHKGFLARAEIEPFVDAFGKSDPFIKLQISASHYLKLAKSLIWANRVNIGSIAGAEAENIPATERFFAGGGGSVRGFAYQEVGPKENDSPVGGRSLTELSTEFRYKFNDTMGVVAFVDAGQVSNKTSPEFTDLSVGAGVGFRYYTDFGPLRFDIATPLTDAETVDSKFQIYLSIGQAF